MYKVSELISMPVISLYDSMELGIISNVLFDAKYHKCKYLIILNDKNGIQQILDCKNIIKIGSECVFIKNSTMLELSHNQDKNTENSVTLINNKCYSLEGKYYGTSNDVILDDKLKVNQIIFDNLSTILEKNISNLGKVILINLDSNQKTSLAKYKPKTKIQTNKKDNMVKIMIDTIEKDNAKPYNTKSSINKIITDYKFLIGRIINKQIQTPNGEIIARPGTTINKDLVNKASVYGKLVEIARYSQ